MMVLEKPLQPNQISDAGEKLKSLRKIAGWSQARMGEVLGYSQSHIDNLETGRRILTVEFDYVRNLVIVEKQAHMKRIQIEIESISKL